MKSLKKGLFWAITKLETVDYVLVIILWAVGALIAPFGFPWIVLGILGLHAFETVTIGLKTGLDAGEGKLYSLVMCMTFGFTWWVPLKYRMQYGDE